MSRRSLTTTSYAILGVLAFRPWPAYDLTGYLRASPVRRATTSSPPPKIGCGGGTTAKAASAREVLAANRKELMGLREALRERLGVGVA